MFGVGNCGWLKAFSASSRNCSRTGPVTVVFLRSDRSTLLMSSNRTESNRSGKVRTFETSCCAGDPVERVDVEPALEGPLAVRDADVVGATGEQQIAEVADRPAGLVPVDPDICQPPMIRSTTGFAFDPNRRPRPNGSSTMPLSDYAVRRIEIRDLSNRRRIPWIQKGDRLLEARPRVADVERVAAREAPLQAELQRVVPRLSFVRRRIDRRRSAGRAAAAAVAESSRRGIPPEPTPA